MSMSEVCGSSCGCEQGNAQSPYHPGHCVWVEGPDLDETARLLTVAEQAIRQAIEAAGTPSERALLMVLLEIDRGLSANTEATNRIAVQFQVHSNDVNNFIHQTFRAHVEDEQRLLNRGLGAWMVLSSLLAAIITVGGWYIGHHILNVNEAQQVQIDAYAARLVKLETAPPISIEASSRLGAIEALLRAQKK
jgi:hypothetical protein